LVVVVVEVLVALEKMPHLQKVEMVQLEQHQYFLVQA
jgi:hypothetical protein